MKILFITAILMMGALITNCAEDRPTPHPQENSKPGSQSNKNNNAGKPGKEANKPERSPKVNKLMAQGLTEKEAVLYLVISEYRRSLGLPVLPFSKSLTVVARAHVKDSNANHPENQVNAEGVKGQGNRIKMSLPLRYGKDRLFLYSTGSSREGTLQAQVERHINHRYSYLSLWRRRLRIYV